MSKTFDERMKEIAGRGKTKGGKKKTGHSRTTFNEVVNILVNSPDYEQVTVQMKGDKPITTKTPVVENFREKLLTPILNDVKMDKEDQKEYIKKYNFTRSQTDGIYDIATAAIYEYMEKTGRSFRFPNTEDFNATIKLRENPASVYENKKTGVKVKRDAFTSLVKKSSCPAWKKHKV